MRNPWKILGALAVLALVAGMVGSANRAVAQTSPQDEIKERLQRLSDALNLSDEQKAKLKPILQDQVDQLRAVRDDASLTAEQKKTKAKQIHEAGKAKINEILTPEQREKWQKMKEEAAEENKGS